MGEIRFTSSNKNINAFLQMGRLLSYLEQDDVCKANKQAEIKYAKSVGLIDEETEKELIAEFC